MKGVSKPIRSEIHFVKERTTLMKKFNETLDTLGEIGYWLGVRFERYIEENKDDILELLGILGAFFVMWWITVAIEADKIFKAILIMVIGYSIVMLYEKCIHE